MTEAEVQKKLKEANLSWEDFNDWMLGRTVGINKDGTTDFYDHDVNRFIRYKKRVK